MIWVAFIVASHLIRTYVQRKAAQKETLKSQLFIVNKCVQVLSQYTETAHILQRAHIVCALRLDEFGRSAGDLRKPHHLGTYVSRFCILQ